MTQTFGLYDTNEAIKPLQRFLNEKLNLNLKVDGNIGKVTQEAILNYQKSCKVVETNDNGACYGKLTQANVIPFTDKKYIKDSDYVLAAFILEVEAAAVKAFAITEAKEFGFLPNGFPVILFERHKFYKAVAKASGSAVADSYAAIYPTICNSKAGGYVGGSAEIKRLDLAITLNPAAANASASWGLFQIMGFNYSVCGYSSLDDFINDMKTSEKGQLMAFVGFIKSNPTLHKALKNKDWPTVAKNYNGAAYAINQYDVKMAKNYNKVLGTI